jgi:hypothetical protein
MKLYLSVGLKLAASSAVAQAQEVIFDRKLYETDCFDKRGGVCNPGEVYIVKDAANTGTAIYNVQISITRGFAGLPHLTVGWDYYNYNWSFTQKGDKTGLGNRDIGTELLSVLYFAILDENNKPITMQFEPNRNYVRVGPGPNYSFHTFVNRSHCTLKGDEHHSAYGVDLRNLSGKPVTAELDDNHFLGPNIGPC